MKRLLSILVLAYAAASAGATTVHYGHGIPDTIEIPTSGIVNVWFNPSTQVQGSFPACAGTAGTAGTGDFKMVFDSTTPGGKSMLATLLAQHAAGAPFWYFGSGDCGVDGTDESLAKVDVN